MRRSRAVFFRSSLICTIKIPFNTWAQSALNAHNFSVAHESNEFHKVSTTCFTLSINCPQLAGEGKDAKFDLSIALSGIFPGFGKHADKEQC